jgi:hypothetical protein
MPPGHYIRRYGSATMADMRHIIDIVNWGSDIKLGHYFVAFLGFLPDLGDTAISAFFVIDLLNFDLILAALLW